MRFALSLLLLSSTALAERLTVEDAEKLALQNNPRLRATQVRARATHDLARSSRGRMGFAIRLGEEYQHFDCPFAIDFATFKGGCSSSFSGMPLVAREQDTNTFSAIADQPLLGLLHRGYDFAAQKDQAGAADAGVQTGEAALREGVRAGFLRFFQARALEQIAASSVMELEEQVKTARARLKAGVITNADLLRVVVAQANARQQQIVAASQAEVSRAALLELIGLGDDNQIELAEPSTLLAQAAQPLPDAASAAKHAEARPELQQARLSRAAAHNTRKSRYLSLLPEIDAEGGYLRIDGQLFAPPNQWFVGARASWTLWEWGTSFYQARAAGRLAEAAALDVEAVQRGVTTEVRTSLSQAQAAGAAVDVAQQAIASAEEAYRVMQALVQAGSATTTDLLDAQSALTTARLNLARAQYERALRRVQLTRVLAE